MTEQEIRVGQIWRRKCNNCGAEIWEEDGDDD